MEYNTENLVGTSIGVLDDNGNIIKNINIVKATNTKNGLIVFDEDGTPYHEDELNWSYKVTAEYLLYNTLENNDIELPKWDYVVWQKIFKDFMESLIKAGYIAETQN